MSSVAQTAPKTSSQTAVCDLRDLIVRPDPFPHVIQPQFVRPSLYRELCSSFPRCPPSTGPTGFSLFWGDEGYTQLLDEQPAWRALFDFFQSQSFIDWGREQFAGVWEQAGCRMNLSEAHYVRYCEDRIDKERGTLRRIEHQPHELWVRMDIHQGQLGYDRVVHVDHARRLISMLIYMCDHSENQIVGGELFLHRDGALPSDSATRITPRHNLMVAFPCTASSYHSVSEITAMAAPRNYIQVHISSSVDIWPRKAAPRAWRMRLRSLKRRVQKSLLQ